MTPLLVFLNSAFITAALQLAGFAHGYAFRTEVFYDIIGGFNFLVLTVFSALVSDGWVADGRKVAATLIFVASRGWLLSFLAWRAHERGGDSRFDAVKDKFGKFLVFWTVQGMWVLLVSSPVLFINASPASASPASTRDAALLAGFLLGVAFEVVADVQKARWVKQGRQGGFCTAGLWQFSRHPNYFGEMLQWWCVWLLAFSCSSGVTDVLWWATSASPLFTMHILLNVPATGVTHANGKNLERYYDKFPETYAEYRASTSILLPMVGYRHVPMILKRTMLLDLERYEYRPQADATSSTNSTRGRKAE